MSEGSGFQILPWDSEFFGVRVAEIRGAGFAIANRARCLEWCRKQDVDCAYLFAATGDQDVLDAAMAEGFRLVEVRVSLQTRSLVSPPRPALANVTVRSSRESDIEPLSAIARRTHRDTRFYVDGRFGHHRCDALYELWIAKSCRGWADHVVVGEREGVPVGYVTCHRSDSRGRIGLVAVAPDSRGLGIGPLMIAEAVRWFAEQGAASISVATQSRNPEALALYQKTGFFVASLDCVFHKWFSREEPL